MPKCQGSSSTNLPLRNAPTAFDRAVEAFRAAGSKINWAEVAEVAETRGEMRISKWLKQWRREQELQREKTEKAAAAAAATAAAGAAASAAAAAEQQHEQHKSGDI